MLAEPRELDEILRTVVGSGVHGIAIPGTDDHDEMGVFIEPPASVVGLGVQMDSDLWRTQPEGHRSGHGDIDLMRYSLRKFVRLAVHGNPSILVPLYAPKDYTVIETRLGRELRDLAPSIVSKQAGQRFLGYMQSQLERMQGGGRQSRVPKRPELIEKYGYDVKYASHALRLAIQGVELLETGRLELPMRDDYRTLVRSVKTGGFTQLGDQAQGTAQWGRWRARCQPGRRANQQVVGACTRSPLAHPPGMEIVMAKARTSRPTPAATEGRTEAEFIADRLIEKVWQGDEAKRGIATQAASVALAAIQDHTAARYMETADEFVGRDLVQRWLDRHSLLEEARASVALDKGDGETHSVEGAYTPFGREDERTTRITADDEAMLNDRTDPEYHPDGWRDDL